MINQKFKIVFQISQPANIPQNGPLDVRFQMRLTQTFFFLCKNQTKNMAQSFRVF